jgi:virginiamycin B lyase
MTKLAASILTFSLLLGTPLVSAAELPAGPAKGMVEGVCTGCHQPSEILRSSGYTKDGWRELTSTMVDLSASPAEREQILDYLATNFPPNPNRVAKAVPGPREVEFKMWQVPTLGQRSRDPVEAPDSGIWWAGQWGNLVGRLDPKTGATKEYPLPPNALPHTVTPDRDGNVWYTGNRNGTIGKLDVKTGQITEYKMPDPAAKDPHTAVFDEKGRLWFSLQISNMIGRLDPATGDIKLVKAPTAGSRPYGVVLDANQNPWVACNGSNCLLKVDPETMAVVEYKLPSSGSTVRRLDIGPEGYVWFVNSTLGRVGRLDPKSGQVKEWDSPSGPKSHPYALAAVDGIVWYNESGVRPDMLVRFDPATETFQSWPVPTGGIYAGSIRHMRPTRDGSLLIHQTSTNRIGIATVKEPAFGR